MIENWLEYNKEDEQKFVFTLVEITEKGRPDDDFVKLLQEEILISYRSEDFYEFHFRETASEKQIKDYRNNFV